MKIGKSIEVLKATSRHVLSPSEKPGRCFVDNRDWKGVTTVTLALKAIITSKVIVAIT